MLKEIKILKGQTLADITIQELGWIDGLFDLAITNEIGITDAIEAGNTIAVDELKINNTQYRLIKLAKIIPASGFDAINDGEGVVLPGGIGYMGLGIDFKTS